MTKMEVRSAMIQSEIARTMTEIEQMKQRIAEKAQNVEHHNVDFIIQDAN